MRIIGHRGVPAQSLENTMESFHAALDLGLTELEFDIRMSRDGVPVVIHDASLKRTHGLPKRVAHTTAKELSSLGVPTFDELYSLIEEKGVHATIEIKTCSLPAIAYIARQSAKLNLTVSSFDFNWIMRAAQANSDVSLQWTIGRLGRYQPFVVPELVSSGRVKEAAVDIRYLTREGVGRARALGLDVLAYTVKTPSQAQKAQELEVDGIFVDDPVAVRQWLSSPGTRSRTRPTL